MDLIHSCTDFNEGKAAPYGDCFPLSAHADYEISSADARNPDQTTTRLVTQTRRASVDLLAGRGMIGGTQSRTLRENEGLPPGCRAAHTLLKPFKKAGYWRGEGTSGGDFTTFMLGFAIVIKRPIIVFERQGGCILTPIKVYGARNAATGVLLLTQPRNPKNAKLVAFTLHSVEDVIDMMRHVQQAPCSVLEYNGSHFDPWVKRCPQGRCPQGTPQSPMTSSA